MSFRGLLIREGSSDAGLQPHLEELCRRAGRSISITCPDPSRLPDPPGRSVLEVAERLLQIDPDFDVLFVHRDADSPEPEQRHVEIEAAVQSLAIELPHVGVVPVQMTEAWLLLDESAIRYVAGNPRGTNDLGLPALRLIEATTDPKSLLKEALLEASGFTGRRRKTARRRFPQHRAQLLAQLDIDGPVNELPAWRTLVERVESVCRALPEE